MRYRLQRHDGTVCSATMVPIQRYRQNRQYQRAVKNSQYRLWRPYMLSLAHYWCGMKNCLDFCIDDGLEYEIMPYFRK